MRNLKEEVDLQLLKYKQQREIIEELELNLVKEKKAKIV